MWNTWTVERKRETFWKHRLKTFYLYRLYEKKNYQYYTRFSDIPLIRRTIFQSIWLLLFVFRFLFWLFFSSFSFCAFLYLYSVADQVFWIHFCPSNFFFSVMVWSIIFYFCRLFVIVFLSLFFITICYLLFIYSSLLCINRLLLYIS